MKPKEKIAVVLFQLGGPDSLEAVQPFLTNLFLDPDIIDFPMAGIARGPLARYIASRRTKKVSEKYREIGGKSPISELTQQQAKALEAELRSDTDATVFVAMRYWHPMTEAVVRQLMKEQYDRIVLLPLYPQYSKTTTSSSLNEWTRWCSKLGMNHVPQNVVDHFYDHRLYIDAVIERVNQTLKKFPDVPQEHPTLLFSAHGIPMSVIQSGDPYENQIKKTVELVLNRGGWNLPHTLCFQSKVGPGRWLRPSLDETIRALGIQGVKTVLVIPIAFVSDHIETLHEIDIEARELAEKVGITHFAMMPGLNSHPKFIQALADLVRTQLKNV